MGPKKLLYIDSMRGWAILMVIACHQALCFGNLSAPIRLLASYGQTGVFLFFVASAFTLCNSSTGREGEDNATRNFFIRRYFRIAPLYYTGIVFYLVLRALLPENSGLLGSEQPARNVLANIALVHGFMPSAFTGVVPGGWSIGTECAFYLMFPLLFSGCLKMQNQFGWKILLVPTGIVAAASALILAKVGISNNIFWFWYDFILNQLPVFMTGIILFFLVQREAFQPDLRRDVPMFLLFSAAGIWALKMNLFIVLPVVSAISFVFLFNILRFSILTDGLIERIGRVSYSMYIFHFAAVLFAAKAVPIIFPAQDTWQNAAYGMALVISTITTFLISRVSEKYIEQRFITYGRTLAKSSSPSLVLDN